MIADISVDISQSDDKPTLCIDKNEMGAPKRGEVNLAVHVLGARASGQLVFARVLRCWLPWGGRTDDVAVEKFWLARCRWRARKAGLGVLYGGFGAPGCSEVSGKSIAQAA